MAGGVAALRVIAGMKPIIKEISSSQQRSYGPAAANGALTGALTIGAGSFSMSQHISKARIIFD